MKIIQITSVVEEDKFEEDKFDTCIFGLGDDQKMYEWLDGEWITYDGE